MTEIATIDLILYAAALVLGLATNLLLALQSASKSAGGPVNPIKWIRKRPYRTAIGFVGGLAGFVVLLSAGQMTAVLAFVTGYCGQDVPDKLAGGNGNLFGAKVS